VFTRDIRSTHTVSWKKCTHNELIWNNGEKDIGWRYEKGTLSRKEGRYSTQWDNATTSIVISGITDCTFTTDMDGATCRGIELRITPIIKDNDMIIYCALSREGK
jgi:hypothetical protein